MGASSTVTRCFWKEGYSGGIGGASLMASLLVPHRFLCLFIYPLISSYPFVSSNPPYPHVFLCDVVLFPGAFYHSVELADQVVTRL